MKKLEKELRVVWGTREILLHLMESYNPDTMDQDFVSEKFDSIMISFYDHKHRRLAGNWMCNQWHCYNENDNFHFPTHGYAFSNFYARRSWDGVIIRPFENDKLHVPGDVSMSTRMDRYCKLIDLNLPHFLWGSTLLLSKIRFIRVSFRQNVITSDDESLVIERGYEYDATGERVGYPIVEHWYENEYSYPDDEDDECYDYYDDEEDDGYYDYDDEDDE